MSQRSGGDVPKFGSFKPRAATNSSMIKTKPETNHARRQNKSREPSENHEKRTDNSRDRVNKRKADGSHRGPNESRYQQSVEPQEPDCWMMDVRGDVQNVQFGSLHRYTVPSYHRAGQGSVIGLPPDIKIDRKQSSDTGMVFQAPRSVKSPPNIPSLRSLSFKYTEIESADEDYLELDDEHWKDDDEKSTAVGVGIWKFIENNDTKEQNCD